MTRRSGFALVLLVLTGCTCACLARKSDDHLAKPAMAARAAMASASRGTLLADHGTASMQVVIAKNASAESRQSANELAAYLGQATGARFEVSPGDGSRGIVVGTAQEFDPGADAPGLAIRDTYDGREAFLIRAEPNRVLLLGATRRGVSHAVFAFLETLGFRWYFPAKEWEVVPQLPTLRTDAHVVDRPRILARQLVTGFGFFDPQARTDMDTWERHNRIGESLAVRISHAWEAIILINKAKFDKHPEYYAIAGGQRSKWRLCVSNPDVQRIVLGYVNAIFDKNPDIEMVSVEASDGAGHCECDRCKALGPPGEQPFFLANYVARALQKSHPGKLVGVLAYSDHSQPPSKPLEPNVLVEITNGFNYGAGSFTDMMDTWPKMARHIGYYEYLSVYQRDKDSLELMRGGDVGYLSRAIRNYVAHGAMAVTAECGNNWGPYGRGYYVASRLLWNPDVDVARVLDDFYTNAFHAAAKTMRRFYERFDPGNDPHAGWDLLGQVYSDLAEAALATRGDAAVQARLDQLKQYAHYVYDYMKLVKTKDPVPSKPIVLDLLTETYRTRRSYMNHWRAIWMDFLPQVAKGFDEPSWNRITPGSHPWQVEALPTHEETERRFQTELALLPHYPTAKMPVFSDKMVRGQFDAGRAGEQSFFSLSTPSDFVLFSQAGEPLEFTITTALMSVYKNKPAARWSLVDAERHPVAEGRLPLDSGVHPVTQPVPAAGVYYLAFNDSGAGFRLSVPPGRAATLALTSGKHPTIGTLDRLYFYVPKGTQVVEYFWYGSPHRVNGPDGATLKVVEDNQTRVRVPVPKGADGKVWALQGVHSFDLRFFSVPSYVATARDALLVPEDVARTDGIPLVVVGPKAAAAVAPSPVR